MSLFRQYIEDESGATAIEYGLIATLIAVAMIPAIVGPNGLATNIHRVFWCNNHMIGGAPDPSVYHSCRTIMNR